MTKRIRALGRLWAAASAMAVAPWIMPAQTHVDLRTQAKSVDLSQVGPTKPAQTGSALPATCAVGQVFFLTNATPGGNLMVCASANQWTASGGGSALTLQANGGSAATSTTLNLTPGTYVTQTIACASGTCSYQPDVDTTRIPTNAAIQAGQLTALTTTSSSATTFTAVLAANNPLTVYTANQQFVWNVGSTACAGGAMTLNISGLGAVSLYAGPTGTTYLTASQCGVNAAVPLIYDSVTPAWRAPAVSYASGSGSTSAPTSAPTPTTISGTTGDLVVIGSGGAPTDSGFATGSGGTGNFIQISGASSQNYLQLGGLNRSIISDNEAIQEMDLSGYNGYRFWVNGIAGVQLAQFGGGSNTNTAVKFFGTLTDAALSATATGDQHLCISSSTGTFTVGGAATCGTSLRIYKKDVSAISLGSSIQYLMKMAPVSFSWKSSGRKELGFIADDMARIDYRLGDYGRDGKLQNVNDRAILAVAVRALQEEHSELRGLELFVLVLAASLALIRRKK